MCKKKLVPKFPIAKEKKIFLGHVSDIGVGVLSTQLSSHDLTQPQRRSEGVVGGDIGRQVDELLVLKSVLNNAKFFKFNFLKAYLFLQFSLSSGLFYI
jgi:hypothetical protein